MTDPIFKVFMAAGVVVVSLLIAIGVIVVQALRSVEIGDQLYLPLTAEEYASLDDAVVRVAGERLDD